MEVTLLSTKRRVKKLIVQDHYWYDPETKARLYGRGGRMIFVYDHKRKKSVPRIVDLEGWVSEDSYDDILKWVKDNGLQITHQLPGHHIAIEINSVLWSDLEDDLICHKIAYDYDERELRQETSSRKEKTWQNSQSKWLIRLQH